MHLSWFGGAFSDATLGHSWLHTSFSRSIRLIGENLLAIFRFRFSVTEGKEWRIFRFLGHCRENSLGHCDCQRGSDLILREVAEMQLDNLGFDGRRHRPN
jgi:hypothetical protein